MQPLVSIIVPCYNGEKYLGRFFQSILAQTYPKIELVFIDDGSTDKTLEVVDSFRGKLEARGIKLILQTQENKGQASALNHGLKLFTGDYLNWMDSDDEIMPEFIEKKVEFLSTHPHCAYCYGKINIVTEDSPDDIIETIEKRETNEQKALFKDVLYVHNVFFPGYMARTTDFDRVIPNREIYTGPGGQNAQLLLPLSWYYGEPGYAEEAIYKYYIRENSHSHAQNSSRQIIRQLENYEKILINTLERISDSEAHIYIEKVKQYYARQRFGNAVDTKDPELIHNCFLKLCQVGVLNLHDVALYLKYSYWIRLKRVLKSKE